MMTSYSKQTGRVHPRPEVRANHGSFSSQLNNSPLLLFCFNGFNYWYQRLYRLYSCFRKFHKSMIFSSLFFLFSSKATVMTRCGFLFILCWFVMTKGAADTPHHTMLLYCRVKLLSYPSVYHFIQQFPFLSAGESL